MTDSTTRVVPCVLMRGGTSRGPFFLRKWLPEDDVARDEALVGAIGASDLVPVDGVEQVCAAIATAFGDQGLGRPTFLLAEPSAAAGTA